MPTANIVELCQAVADALNAADVGTFEETFTAEFIFAPEYSVMDAKTLRVIVTDAGGDLEMIARSRLGFTDNVRVVILWRVDAAGTGLDATKIGRGLTLLEEISRFLVGKKMADYNQTGTARRADGEKEKNHYMPGNLQERTFAAALVLPYVTTENLTRETSS